MIRPKEMVRVRIISHSQNIRSVIESLYELKLLHIIDSKKGEHGLDIGKPLAEAAGYSQQLIDIRAAISRLGITGNPLHVENIKGAQHRFEGFNKAFKDIVTRLDALETEESALSDEVTNPLAGLGISKHNVKGYKSLASFTGTVRMPLDKRLEGIDCILMQKRLERQIAIALFVPHKAAQKARDVLAAAGFTEGRLPEISRDDAEAKLANVRRDIAALKNQLGDSMDNNAQFLIDYEFALTQLNEKAEAPLHFAASRNAFVTSGWVPKEDAEKLAKALEGVTKEKVSVEVVHDSNPPTLLENPRLIKNFEFLLNLYSLPKHSEIDPTMLMFFTFPLFFGFMLGDVGYGLITLALMLVLEKRAPSAKPLIRIMTVASLASIAFGFVFGEAFGYEFVEHPVLNRIHDVTGMMTISVLIGVLHLNLGFLLGIANEMKHHGFFVAFLRKGSWILLQASVAIMALGYMQQSQAMQAAGGIASLASVAMIIKGEGLLRIVELPALLSNMLSYIRLYAIGLSSVSLALVVNEMASKMFSQGIIGAIGGVLILLMGHTVNLLLGLLGPFLHSVRLHYVEFFQKFYEGGGYSYSPFGLVKRLGSR